MKSRRSLREILWNLHADERKEEVQAATGFQYVKPQNLRYRRTVMLIMCGNDVFMLKPGLIYEFTNPRALENKNKDLLSLHSMHNPKAWITKILILNWFQQCFIPQAKEYRNNLCMAFKILLVMDYVGGHHLYLYYGVQVEFLPINTTSLIQPMDQGVIGAFIALYSHNSLQHLVDAIDLDENFTLKWS